MSSLENTIIALTEKVSQLKKEKSALEDRVSELAIILTEVDYHVTRSFRIMKDCPMHLDIKDLLR